MQEFERQKIADAMEPKKFEDGDMIIEQVIFPQCTSKCSFGNFSALKMTSSALIIVIFRVIPKPIISILLWTVKSDLLFVTSPVKNKKSR